MIGINEAKRHFSELIAEVESGETIILVRSGKAVAKLQPITDDAQDAVRRIRALRGLRASASEIVEWIDEGRSGAQ